MFPVTCFKKSLTRNRDFFFFVTVVANDHIFSMKISVWCGTLEVNSALKHGFHIHFGGFLVIKKKNRKKLPKKDLTRRQKIKPARVTGNKQFFF